MDWGEGDIVELVYTMYTDEVVEEREKQEEEDGRIYICIGLSPIYKRPMDPTKRSHSTFVTFPV